MYPDNRKNMKNALEKTERFQNSSYFSHHAKRTNQKAKNRNFNPPEFKR